MKLRVVGLCVAVGLFGLAGSVSAHDGSTNATFLDWTPQIITHEEDAPYKGLFSLTVVNSSQNVWGDFHFAIWGASDDAKKVVFEAPPISSSQMPFTYNIGTNPAGFSTLDLYFYDAPVMPGGTALFVVYTDNTAAQNEWFSIMFMPTPIPEPSTLGLFAVGALLLAWRSTRRKAA
jgi:hypothetical protein